MKFSRLEQWFASGLAWQMQPAYSDFVGKMLVVTMAILILIVGITKYANQPMEASGRQSVDKFEAVIPEVGENVIIHFDGGVAALKTLENGRIRIWVGGE